MHIVIESIICYREGSVICSFNVTYDSVDSMQIVSFLEEIAGRLLGDIPVELDKIETSNGKHSKVYQPECSGIICVCVMNDACLD